MRRRQVTRVVLAAFLIGAAAPFLISIFAILVSFNTGLRVATIFAPAMVMADKWPDPLIPLANGFLYGCLACAVMFLLRRRS